MKHLLKHLLNLILPPRCIKCGEVLLDDNGLCSECFNELNFISQPYCKKCGQPFLENIESKTLLCPTCVSANKNPIRLSRSVMEYDDAAKPLILGFKFFDKTENAKLLGRLLCLAIKDIVNEEVDVIMPVPLHYTRLLKRKYNQSALLTKEVSKLIGVKVDYSSLKRVKKTKPQVEFSGRARVENVKNAFKVKNIAKVKGKRVLLIDDVLTTGSTLKECALALKKAGAISVDTLTLARVVR